MYDRTWRTLSLSLACLNMPTARIITQTIFAVQSTSGSLLHLREIPGCLIWHLPQVFICHYLSTNCILSLQIQCNEWLCILLIGLQPVGGGLSVNLGVLGHLSPCHLHNSIGGLLPHQPKGLGGCREVPQWHHISPGLYWGGDSRRQYEWSLHGMGEPLSDQGPHCGGSS